MTIKTSNIQIKRLLKTLLQGSLDAVDPAKAMKQLIIRKKHNLKVNSVNYDLTTFQRIVCVGAGKASGHMGRILEQILGDNLEGGIAIVKDGYGTPTKKIQIIEAGHPTPDTRGVQATKHVLKIVNTLSKQDLLILLLSGGASSLLCEPATGLTLGDTQQTTNMLLRCGANIQEINTVRKHLSAIKGGHLAQATSARILTVVISDVIGDDLTTIGSGPSIPDLTTFREAQSILKQYQIWGEVPVRVQMHIEQGIKGAVPETWKRKKPYSSRHQSIILANNQSALTGVAQQAKQLGLRTHILDFPLQGEAQELGPILSAMARDIREFNNPVQPPACFIAGGEPTVTVSGKGKGGRAQECVLAAAKELAGLTNVVVAGFGTDGTDGPTNAAGAMVDWNTRQRAKKKGLSIEDSLKRHDSYTFFNQVGGHIITGPTKTNVNDIYLIIVL